MTTTARVLQGMRITLTLITRRINCFNACMGTAGVSRESPTARVRGGSAADQSYAALAWTNAVYRRSILAIPLRGAGTSLPLLIGIVTVIRFLGQAVRVFGRNRFFKTSKKSLSILHPVFGTN